MKFMMLMNAPGKVPYAVNAWSKDDLGAHIRYMKTFAQKLQKAGELVLAEGLTDPTQAKLVRADKDGKPLTDGVFPETKEFLAGWWIIDVDSAEIAYQRAAEASMAPGPGGKPMFLAIEVRQVGTAPKTDE
jgi:hypothetical protein